MYQYKLQWLVIHSFSAPVLVKVIINTFLYGTMILGRNHYVTWPASYSLVLQLVYIKYKVGLLVFTGLLQKGCRLIVLINVANITLKSFTRNIFHNLR